MLRDLESDGISTEYLQHRVKRDVVPNIRRLASAFRLAGATVAFVRIGSACADFRDAHPIIRPHLESWNAIDGTWECAVIDELAPEPNDLSLVKSGSGAFTTSSLDQHLRNSGVRDVFYTGVVTHACVMLTAVAGFDLGYRGHLVRDATATFSPQVQEATEQLIGFTVELTDTGHVLNSIGAPR